MRKLITSAALLASTVLLVVAVPVTGSVEAGRSWTSIQAGIK